MHIIYLFLNCQLIYQYNIFDNDPLDDFIHSDEIFKNTSYDACNFKPIKEQSKIAAASLATRNSFVSNRCRSLVSIITYFLLLECACRRQNKNLKNTMIYFHVRLKCLNATHFRPMGEVLMYFNFFI